MEGKAGKICNLHASNRISYEDLKNIEESFFEEVYKEADRTLYKIIKDEKIYSGKDGKDDTSLNVLSFLGKRGRGKTSTMLSFLFSLNRLHEECKWSEFHKHKEEIQFIDLPYIDAAMLAENEYIFDVILAEMWDKFEKHMELKIRGQVSEDTEYLEQKIKRAFINVRKAYLTLKEREKEPIGRQDKDTLAPSALHDLAASLNLSSETKKLVNDYLKIFGREKETYLVITIDDIDMSVDKAQPILEQIRRFLRIPRVIVFLTADIDRLQRACEARYQDIYTDTRDLQQFVDEYLEKTLPYNMRMYMPEVKDRYDEIEINVSAREELELQSTNEKDMILEFIARECGIHFDGVRKKRHFLQNQSIRSMVNYFEQLVRVKETDMLSWLKVDLRERLVERIQKVDQRAFMRKLLFGDYEDIDGIVISYINRTLRGEKEIEVEEMSLGQVLYGCRLLEKEDPENADFVNSILMLYSIIIGKADEGLRRKVIGNSVFGEWEYTAVRSNLNPSDICQGFNDKGKLSIDVGMAFEDANAGKKPSELLDCLLKGNEETITAWVYALTFYKIVPLTGEYSFTLIEDIGSAGEGEKKSSLILEPAVIARKNYFQCLYDGQGEIYDVIFDLLKAAVFQIGGWVYKTKNKEISEKELKTSTQKKAMKLLTAMKFTKKGAEELSVVPVQDVEIFYSIGQALESAARPAGTSAQQLFDAMILQYRGIQEKLKRTDTYYEHLQQPTNFEEKFMDSLQARLLLGKMEMSDTLRKKFVEIFGMLLSEAVGTKIVIKTPER